MDERTLFIDAVQKLDLAERAAYVKRACAGDAALQRRVELLLETHAREGGILETTSPLAACDTTQTDPSPPEASTTFVSCNEQTETMPITNETGTAPTDATELAPNPDPANTLPLAEETGLESMTATELAPNPDPTDAVLMTGDGGLASTAGTTVTSSRDPGGTLLNTVEGGRSTTGGTKVATFYPGR